MCGTTARESRIKVAVRLRPSGSSSSLLLDAASNTVVARNSELTFTYSELYDEGTSQEKLYAACVRPLQEKFLAGSNVTVMAYGQTGAGKTYTIGSPGQADRDSGLIQRSIDYVFYHLRDLQGAVVQCSYVEIYKEQLLDLLAPKPQGSKLAVLEKVFGTRETAVTVKTVETKEEAHNLFNVGFAKRVTGCTALNASSTRAHAVFTIYLTHTTTRKMHFVDLAGSENSKKANTQGVRLQEAASINQSLLVLGRVFKALVQSSRNVPYRDSRLTKLLQDSLSGNGFTCLISCVSTEHRDIGETLNTLTYAAEAMNIKSTKTKQSVIVEATKRKVCQLVEEAVQGMDQSTSTSKEAADLLARLDAYSIWDLLLRVRGTKPGAACFEGSCSKDSSPSDQFSAPSPRREQTREVPSIPFMNRRSVHEHPVDLSFCSLPTPDGSPQQSSTTFVQADCSASPSTSKVAPRSPANSTASPTPTAKAAVQNLILEASPEDDTVVIMELSGEEGEGEEDVCCLAGAPLFLLEQAVSCSTKCLKGIEDTVAHKVTSAGPRAPAHRYSNIRDSIQGKSRKECQLQQAKINHTMPVESSPASLGTSTLSFRSSVLDHDAYSLSDLSSKKQGAIGSSGSSSKPSRLLGGKASQFYRADSSPLSTQSAFGDKTLDARLKSHGRVELPTRSQMPRLSIIAPLSTNRRYEPGASWL